MTSARNTGQLLANGPLYKEVRRRLLRCLAEGEWKPGERIPSEAQLAQRFGVAVSTIRAGIKHLAEAGILIRWQGRGTFVARHELRPQGFRFSNIYNNAGEKVFSQREIISVKRVRPDDETVEKLRLGDSELIYQIEALLKTGDTAVATMALILPARLFRNLRVDTLRQTEENLYSVYQRRYGITVVRMDEWVRARKASREIAGALGIPVNDPVLEVERIAYSFNDVPVEIRRRTYEATHHQYLFSHDRLE